MRSIRPLPPRGITTSTNCGMVMSWPTASRSVVCTSCTASAGRPASPSACCTSRASALLDSIASEPPRRMQALPLLIDRLAASIVTLGRLSKIMPNTPIGTRIWPTRMPLGCWRRPLISPITSGMAASCSQPSAQVSSTLGVSFRRSTIGSARPAARARSRSRALSVCSAAVCSRSSRASALSTRLRCAAGDAAMRAEAWRACRPSVCMYSDRFSAFMARFSHGGMPKPRHPGQRACIRGTTRWPAGAVPATHRTASPRRAGP